MPVNWDLAQVLVGLIAILATNLIIRSSTWIALRVRKLLYPKQYRCEKLEWSDIPDGLLHECSLPKENCQHLVSGSNDVSESSISMFFIWIRRGRFVPKPDILDAKTEYIRTDQQVLKTLIALNWDRHLCLVFEEVEATTVAYFRPFKPSDVSGWGPINNQIGGRKALTKNEAHRILNGYPPWYAEKIRLRNNDVIPSPIQGNEDFRRGGWIVALGFSKITPTARDCMVRMPEDQKIAVALDDTPIIITRAFRRVIERLGHAADAFPNEPAWKRGKEWLEVAANSEKSSRSIMLSFYQAMIGDLFKDDNGQPILMWIKGRGRDYAANITTQQCQIAMQAFSHPGPFSDEEIQVIEPVMLPVLRAVLVGSFQVLDYLFRSTFVLPEYERSWSELEEKHGPIYLRSWREGD